MTISTLITIGIVFATVWLGYAGVQRWQKSATRAALHGVRKAAGRPKTKGPRTPDARVRDRDGSDVSPNTDPPTFV